MTNARVFHNNEMYPIYSHVLSQRESEQKIKTEKETSRVRNLGLNG